MKRIELLKKAIESNTYIEIILKKTDTHLIYKLYADFLEMKNYNSANIIISIFESDQIRQLFDKKELGEFDDYKKPKNWSEIESMFNEITLSYINKFIENNDLNGFIEALNIWNVTEQFEVGISIDRRMHFNCLDLLPGILHKDGKDKWILSILEKYEQVHKVNKIIKDYLLDSKPLILKKALRILIDTKLQDNYRDIVDPLFTSEIDLYIQAKQYQMLPEFLNKIKYLTQPLFHVLILIYEHDNKLFDKIIKIIHERKSTPGNLLIMALKVYILNNDLENKLFLIKEVENYISNTYTKKVLEEIKIFKQTKKVVKGWRRLSNLSYYLKEAYPILFLSSCASTYFFDFIKFTETYNFNPNIAIDDMLNYVNANLYSNREIIYELLHKKFSKLMETQTGIFTWENKLHICKIFLTNLFNNNIINIHELFPLYYGLIGREISDKIDNKTPLDDIGNSIYQGTNSFPEIYENIFIENIDKKNAYYYVQASFWLSIEQLIAPLKKDEKEFNIIFMGALNTNINHFIDEQKSNEFMLRITEMLNPIPHLLTLKKQVDAFIKMSDKEDFINVTISDVIFSMLEYYNNQAEQKKQDEIIQIRIEERNRIMANLSHTVKNMIGTIIDPLENMKSSNELQPVAIDNAIRGANLVRSLVNAMNLSFKGSIEDFKYDIENTNYKDVTSIKQLFLESLKYSISSMFDGKYFNKFMQNYFPKKPIFIEAKSKWNEVSQSTDLHKIEKFMNEFMLKPEINIETAKDFVIGNDKGSSLKLLILIQEIVFNAVKYSSFIPPKERFIKIEFEAGKEKISIKVSNKYQPKTKVKSSGLGQEIINNFSKLLQTKPIIKTDNEVYSIEVKFENLWEV